MEDNLPSWDLSSLYKNKDVAKAELSALTKRILDHDAKYKGKLDTLSPESLFSVIKLWEGLCDGMGRIGSYAYLCYATNLTSEEEILFYQFVSEKIAEISSKFVCFKLELNALEGEVLDAKSLVFYKPFLEQNSIFKPFELSKDLEEMLIRKSVTSSSAWVRFYDETLASLKFNFNGKSFNISKILDKLSSQKSEERELAGKEIGRVMKDNITTFSFIINTLMKDCEIENEYRGFKNPIDSRNLANFVETEVVDCLIQTVKKNYASISHEYYKVKAKIFGKESLKYWDRNAPLPFDDDTTFSFDEAKKIVLESYAEFSPQMAEIAEFFFKNNWIDAAAKDGKQSGAFAHPTTPSSNPFIMLNFLGKARDVSTMAHELGHGIHQYLARKQGALMCNTPLTLAETASIFGEQLVFQKLLKQVKTKEEKLAIIGAKIEDMLNTVVRQIAFCDFEIILHDARKSSELTSEFISQNWLKIQKESLGDGISFEEEYKYFWSYISHFFHAPFYVYSYAFGDCLVNSLYASYKAQHVQDFEKKYIEMLSTGGAMHHSKLLEPFNIDLKDREFWQSGLDIIKGYITEFKSLL